MDENDKRILILEALRSYRTKDPAEEKLVNQMKFFIESEENCFERSNTQGHITGSAWLLNPDGKKALLTHHKKLNRWLQLGGHSDGNADTWSVALREAQEESGINDIRFVVRDIFDLDIHIIPENERKNEAEHKHYDIRFLLQTSTEQFKISEESHALKWISYHEMIEMKHLLSPAMQRMVKKWGERIKI